MDSTGFVSPLVTPQVSSFARVTVAAPRLVGVVAPRRAAVVSASAADPAKYDELGQKYEKEQADPQDVMDFALKEFPGEVGIAFSGAEDVVLIEYAHRSKQPYRVFALDTGRLHPETYRFYGEVEKHYGIKIEYTFPDSEEVTALVNEKGLFSFYEDGHQECCRVRKVRPLRRKLGTLKAWITGQRKDQSPGTRTEVPMCQADPAFKGQDDGLLVKFNPLANVSSDEVWTMIRMVEVPFNSLHSQGFVSIGCEPCTKAVLPNQHEREGRWWWEEATQKECGLHKGNISKDAADIEASDNYVADVIGSDKVVVFTKTTCQFCKATVALLDELDVNFTNVPVDTMPNESDIAASLERLTGQSTVPNIFIAKKHFGTNDDLQNAKKDGSLRGIFADAGVSSGVVA